MKVAFAKPISILFYVRQSAVDLYDWKEKKERKMYNFMAFLLIFIAKRI